jgi:hypothetical protein
VLHKRKAPKEKKALALKEYSAFFYLRIFFGFSFVLLFLEEVLFF